MKKTHIIHSDYLELDNIREILKKDLQLGISDDIKKQIHHCRTYLEQKLATSAELFYGINTGFGSLCNIRISNDERLHLQENLVRSHACGTGDEVPEEVVRIMLLLKIKNLSLGYSGVRLELVERLVTFFNEGILPVVYQLGSLGASGDLAPLAHLSLPLIGEGEVRYKGQRRPAGEVLAELGIEPLVLEAKEGLALLNGTQFSTSYACWCLMQAEDLLRLANLTAAVSIDGFDCGLSPFDERLHKIRPHKGQVNVAQRILELLEGSEIAQNEKTNVQDPYAFRCVPQVHGASWDAILHTLSVVETEINSVTDNPNIFPDDDVILSGGNFHAQPIALVLDYLAIAMAELGSISERRVYQLISGQRGLPPFLTQKPGLNSGMMILQYTAASIVSQNKQLCTPASVDSIVSCNGQEDHVSMAANAGTKLYRVIENLERLLSIEFLVAMQALEYRPLSSSELIEKIASEFRQVVPKLEKDRILSKDIQITIEYLRTLSLL
ncbi:MAG: histidine ammonia-lyase [Saprospiraceae bacterium]|nr:histidine ammonia-lyase [Saprospiraceae bacterium]MCB9324698.1 histidine ammonia-lyase [Lewinellaceae bacterium]